MTRPTLPCDKPLPLANVMVSLASRLALQAAPGAVVDTVVPYLGMTIGGLPHMQANKPLLVSLRNSFCTPRQQADLFSAPRYHDPSQEIQRLLYLLEAPEYCMRAFRVRS